MALTVITEDGTGVAGANSYADLAQVRAFAAQRGVALPADDDEVIALMTVACDYLEGFESRWQGVRALPLTQTLSWPRNGVMLFGTMLPSNRIPVALIAAQCYLTGIATTVDLNAVQDTRAVTKEVVGPLETDYSSTAGATVRPMIPLLDSMLAALLKSGAGMLKTVRV